MGNLGGDVQYGITSGVPLNATVNPDFGQVEADPATLNLSAYEEFFEERRPFFFKGASIFNFGDWRNQFFYSRRIGRQPGHFGIPDGASELSRPEATTILGLPKSLEELTATPPSVSSKLSRHRRMHRLRGTVRAVISLLSR